MLSDPSITKYTSYGFLQSVIIETRLKIKKTFQINKQCMCFNEKNETICIGKTRYPFN